MATIPAPALPISDFRMAFVSPNEFVRNPYSGAELDLAQGRPGRWVGQIGWDTGADLTMTGSRLDLQRANERTLQAFLGALQGRRNRVDLTLPGAPLYPFQSALPAGATGTVIAAASVAGGLNLTVSLSGAGMAVLAPGNMVRTGGRMYMIRAVSGSVLTVVPEVVPTTGAITVAAVTMPIRIDARNVLAARERGLVLPRYSFAWEEIL